MLDIDEVEVEGFERVIVGHNSITNDKYTLAIHSTTLGPALVGLRKTFYLSNSQAKAYALMAAEKYTYKSAITGFANGGGYLVINSINDNEKTIVEDLGTIMEWCNDTGTRASYCNIDYGLNPSILGELSAYHTAHVVDYHLTNNVRNKTLVECLDAIKVFLDKDNITVNIEGVDTDLIQLCKDKGFDICIASEDMDVAMTTASYYETAVASIDDIPYLEGIYVPLFLRTPIDNTVLAETEAYGICGTALNQVEEEAITLLYKHNIMYIPDFVASSGDVIAAGSWLADDEKNIDKRVNVARQQASALMIAGSMNKLDVQELAVKTAKEIIEKGANNG